MLVAEIFEIVNLLNREEAEAVPLAEQNVTVARALLSRLRDGEGPHRAGRDAKTISENEDINEFYLGLTASESGRRIGT